MNSTKIHLVSCLLFVFATIHLEIEAKNTEEQEESARELIKQCQSLAPFKTLAEFFEFYRNFKQVDSCLHSIKEPAKLCQDAESICERANFNYQDVRSLGVLVERYKSFERVCTIEFASKIYRLHKKLEQLGTEVEKQPLGGPLRILGNRVASGCRKSLAKRLLEVERRTTQQGSALSETIKHLNAIVSFLNVGFDRLERIEIEPEQVNPIHADEWAVASRGLSFGRDGFELKLTRTMETILERVRTSCSSLHRYQVNLLASLGTLASVGYGMSPAASAKLADSRVDKVRIHSWSLSAVLCQSVGGIVKMSHEKVDGKLFRKVKIVVNLEPDVSEDEEQDDVFASYKLSEEQDDRDLNESDESRDSFKFDAKQTNRRRHQLLIGPNYRIVRAIVTYLDLTKEEGRFSIPYEMLGLETPKNQADQEEEEQEEEEEEE